MSRRAANLSIDSALLDEAKELHINISQAAELGIRRVLAAEKAKRWTEENAEVVRSTNEYIARNGLPLREYRSF